jgi:mRNA export factor
MHLKQYLWKCYYLSKTVILSSVLEQVVSPPTDGISSLSFSSKANYLVASSWDNQVLLAVINSNSWNIFIYLQIYFGVAIMAISHAVCFIRICNMQVRCWEIQPNGSSVPKAAISHDQPVRFKAFLPDCANPFHAKSSTQ